MIANGHSIYLAEPRLASEYLAPDSIARVFPEDPLLFEAHPAQRRQHHKSPGCYSDDLAGPSRRLDWRRGQDLLLLCHLRPNEIETMGAPVELPVAAVEPSL